MGRATDWLAEERPTMVTILREIERAALESGGHRNGVELLDAIAALTTPPGGEPRSSKAMRQAWFRWTTDGHMQSTPPVMELALIVRHAKLQGWLKNLREPEAQRLMGRLQSVLMERATPDRSTKKEIQAFANDMAKNLNVQLAERISLRVQAAGLFGPGHEMAKAAIAQQEFRAMLVSLFRESANTLTKTGVVRGVPGNGSIAQPLEGWPDALRAMADDVAHILRAAGEQMERSELQLTAQARLKELEAAPVARRIRRP